MPLLPRVNSAAANRSRTKKQKFKTFMRQWFLVNWRDLLTMAVVGAVAFGVCLFPVFLIAANSLDLSFSGNHHSNVSRHL
jgi:hypothetical protein